MVSDIDTGKSRWYRATRRRSEIDHLFDLYWGGPERRITGLTIRILGVNAVAIVMFLLGLLYLGQYQSKLIHSKLEIFETEIFLITAAITEGGIVHDAQNPAIAYLSADKTKQLIARFATLLGKQVLVFNEKGVLISDSRQLEAAAVPKPFLRAANDESKWVSLEVLKPMASFMLSLLPEREKLPRYKGINSNYAMDYTDAAKAMNNSLSISAWRDEEDQIVLTAAMPVTNQSRVIGATLLISDARDIKEALADAWFDIVKIFLVTSFITILLSIYLSGVIARPLRKLASAAEGVRKGKLNYNDIPDMRDRHDEIGELSLVLREMTQALWERMDAIEAFAADVSHEIKNPLTSLKSAVETAAVVKNKKDLAKLLTIIQHDIERLDRLITDISSASRLDTELSRESFRPVDLKSVLKNLIDSYKDPLKRDQFDHSSQPFVVIKDGVTIRLDLPRYQEVLVLGSEGRLSQVFHNIITNALSFSPPRGEIWIKVARDSGKVRIVFEDQGPGIPENKLETVFDRFYSERPQHEDYGKHSGLGLSICKQIIEAHNGRIYAENRMDYQGNVSGARFVVELNVL